MWNRKKTWRKKCHIFRFLFPPHRLSGKSNGSCLSKVPPTPASTFASNWNIQNQTKRISNSSAYVYLFCSCAHKNWDPDKFWKLLQTKKFLILNFCVRFCLYLSGVMLSLVTITWITWRECQRYEDLTSSIYKIFSFVILQLRCKCQFIVFSIPLQLNGVCPQIVFDPNSNGNSFSAEAAKCHLQTLSLFH